jgi:hypothetical protein
MLDKCAVAGDITQAIDRRGAWTVALTVIGGTANTAVKIQSAPSASGVFTDFKTLISADDADTDQYKGFVVDLHGADKFIKVTGAVMATAVLGDCDHDIKDVTIKAGEVPSGADLEDNKAATIDVSAYTEPVEVSPSDGYDGMKKATVTLSNVPEIEANKAATIDVSTYTEPVEIEPTEGKDGMAKATVTLSNIPSGAGKRTICAQGSMGDSDGYIDVKGFDSASNALSDLPAGTYHFYFFSTDTSGTINTVTAIFADPSKVSVSGDTITVSEDAAFLDQDDTYSAVGYYSALFQATN